MRSIWTSFTLLVLAGAVYGSEGLIRVKKDAGGSGKIPANFVNDIHDKETVWLFHTESEVEGNDLEEDGLEAHYAGENHSTPAGGRKWPLVVVAIVIVAILVPLVIFLYVRNRLKPTTEQQQQQPKTVIPPLALNLPKSIQLYPTRPNQLMINEMGKSGVVRVDQSTCDAYYQLSRGNTIRVGPTEELYNPSNNLLFIPIDDYEYRNGTVVRKADGQPPATLGPNQVFDPQTSKVYEQCRFNRTPGSVNQLPSEVANIYEQLLKNRKTAPPLPKTVKPAPKSSKFPLLIESLDFTMPLPSDYEETPRV